MNDLLKYLKHIKNGIFIEAGAFDGVMQSNTIMLEDKGWTGRVLPLQQRAGLRLAEVPLRPRLRMHSCLHNK